MQLHLFSGNWCPASTERESFINVSAQHDASAKITNAVYNSRVNFLGAGRSTLFEMKQINHLKSGDLPGQGRDRPALLSIYHRLFCFR
jgi:hypothetical protein